MIRSHHLLCKKNASCSLSVAATAPGGRSERLTTAARKSNASCAATRLLQGLCAMPTPLRLAQASKTTSLSGMHFCGCCSGCCFGDLYDWDLASNDYVLDIYPGYPMPAPAPPQTLLAGVGGARNGAATGACTTPSPAGASPGTPLDSQLGPRCPCSRGQRLASRCPACRGRRPGPRTTWI